MQCITHMVECSWRIETGDPRATEVIIGVETAAGKQNKRREN